MADMVEKRRLTLEALDAAIAELRGEWPMPYKRQEHPLTRSNRMKGYTRERGRREIVKECE